MFYLAITLIVLAIALCVPLIVPIGSMYWDSYLYLDAAQRIRMGQVPNLDFAAPVGPLGYYLFTLGLAIFPHAQLLLLAQWSVLAVAAPLMGVVMMDLAPRNRAVAFALLIPFLVFAIAPANVQSFTSYPGLDGFGIYNRHTALLLYVMMCGLLFMRDKRRLAAFCATVMLCLFMMKITGFLVGGLFGLVALLARRISVRHVILTAIFYVAALLVLELNRHMTTAYIAVIAQLIGLNENAILPRFLTVMSAKVDLIVPAGLLVLVLLWVEATRGDRSVRLVDSSPVWLSVALAGGIVLETLNTGSQEFIFLWPVLVMIYLRIRPLDDKARLIFIGLAAFCVIPLSASVAQKTLRAIAVAPTYVQPPVTELRNMAQVSTRPDIMERALLMEDHYTRYGPAYEALARQNQLPSWRFYAELDYQMYWLISADSMVKALRQFETRHGIRLESLMTLDFVNPFPWILDRDAPRAVQIGGDPTRTVPDMTPETKAAIEATDGVLRPKCPITSARLALQRIYGDALRDRNLIQLDPCWDLLLRPGILPAG